MKDFTIYVVWGPDPKSEVGFSVKRYSSSVTEARKWIADAKSALKANFGKSRSQWPWPYRKINYFITTIKASEMLSRFDKYNSKEEAIDALNGTTRAFIF